MKAMIFKMHEKESIQEIENSLENLQKMVGGYIEVISLSKDVILICDEEAKIKGKMLNSFIETLNENKVIFDIAGDYIVCGCDGGEFCSIKDVNIENVLKNTNRASGSPQ